MYDKVFNADMRLCGFFNRACHYNIIKLFFAVVSRLGNGIFWYSLMGFLPLIYGVSSFFIIIQMILSGSIGIIIYKYIKNNTSRLRPYMTNESIMLGAQPLDQFSFPSGHTLHAVSFTNILCFYYPDFTSYLYPIVALIAASRMILGLHYPSDVLAGASIGLMTSFTVLSIFS